MSVREKYGLPRRPSVVVRAATTIPLAAALLVVLWLLLPHSPVGVALYVILALSIVFGAAWLMLSGADAGTSEPGRVDAGGGRDRESARWTEPPSTQSH
jgi:hypothetical protein